ncbi:uncharacterized protein BDV17DRAFT_271189 [Aspergillus undulatus]|uniref:uncharacterized protein n=1 Tax=Aspergillus undulatus TaxID=1810928 RepID=UPI003CCD51C6
MSADQLLYPMEFSGHEEEWLEFDSLFQMPSGCLGSHSISADSISPRDLDQSFTDADFLNWNPDLALYSQAMFPELAGLEPPVEGLDQSALDLQQFINPNDVLQPEPSQTQFVDPGFDYASSFRYMVESQAALDTRCFSQKEKRRDASIALHLQRMQNAPWPDLSTPSLSSNYLSSPNWSESSLEATPCEASFNVTPASESQNSSPPSGPEPGAASMQLVLDLNMNRTMNVPKKQKPRSKAQRENYIKARKYGVCEKHRKQHKRCNCLEKAVAAHLDADVSRAGANTTANLHTNHERRLVNKSPQCSVQSPTSSVNNGLPRPPRQSIRVPQPDLSPTQPLVSPGGAQVIVKQMKGLPRPLARVSRPDMSPSQSLSSTGRDQVTVRKTLKLQKPNVFPTLPVQTFISPTGDNGSQTNCMSSPTSYNRAATQSAPLLVTSRGALNTPALYKDKDSQNTESQQSRLRISASRRTPRQLANTQSVLGSRGSLDVQGVQTTIAGTAITRGLGTARSSTVGLLSPWQGARAVSTITSFAFGHFATFASNLGAGRVARTTTTGLLSLWENSREVASWARSASSALGRLAIVSSRLLVQTRQEMGLL